MAGRCWSIVALLAFAVGARGQVITPLYPAWTPVAPGAAAAAVSAKPAAPSATSAASPSPHWPYYTDSPRYRSATIVGAPAPAPLASYASQPVATMPVYHSPPLAQAPPTVPPAASTVVAPPQTTPPPALPPPPVQEPALPVSEKKEKTKPNAPFVDERVFLPGGKVWREYDVASYTNRFSPADKPEEGIRRWILGEIGPETWHGPDPASLSVSPTKVTVYHTPAVQDQVADILGRFVWYSPGEFHCRVRVVTAKHVRWRAELLPRLRPVAPGEPGREAWFLSRADAEYLFAHFKEGRHGELLADKPFRMANGQLATAFWPGRKTEYVREVSIDPAAPGSLDNTIRPRVEEIEDGVDFAVSPLIAPDAASIDLEVAIKARKLTDRKEVRLDVPGRPRVDVPELASAEYKTRFRLPPGQQVLFSLGILPSIQSQKGLLGRDLREELLILLEITPDPANTVAGKPTPAIAARGPSGEAPVRRTASKPKPFRHIFHEIPPHIF